MNRALRAATLGVLLLSPVALSACSAGEVTQTASQQRDKTGAMAQVGDITVREAEFAYPIGGSYAKGDDVQLRVAIGNDGTEDDTLTSVTGPDFGSATITASAPASGSAGSSAATSTAASSAPSSTSEAATPSASAAPTPSASGAPLTALPIPASSVVFVDGKQYTITLSTIDRSLTTGQHIPVTLTFQKAGDVTLPVTVAAPPRSLDRGQTFDFQREGGQASRGGNEAANGAGAGD